jgi:hypothetical protein
VEVSGWTGVERCAGYVDMVEHEVVTSHNTEFVFYTDAGGNESKAFVNETDLVGSSGGGDDDAASDDDASSSGAFATPSRSQMRDRGLHVLDMSTGEQQCLLNVTNTSTSVALDLSLKEVYLTAGTDILRAVLPRERDGVLYREGAAAMPGHLRLDGIGAENITFITNRSFPPFSIALDLRFHHRYLYWSQPGKSNYAGDGGLFRLKLGDDPYRGTSYEERRRRDPKNAPVIEDLTSRIASSLRAEQRNKGPSTALSNSEEPIITPKGIALDLRKPLLRLYWCDEGNKTRGSTRGFSNVTFDMLDGRILRANLDGSGAEVVLPTGYVQDPGNLVLDLINNTGFVADAVGAIWIFDLEFSANANPNASYVERIFHGDMCAVFHGGDTEECAAADTIRIKRPTALALDYRSRHKDELLREIENLVDQRGDPNILSNPSLANQQPITTMYLYWTDAAHGIVARGSYVSDARTGIGAWRYPTTLKHLQHAYGNTRPLGIALDLGFGIPRGGSYDDGPGLYECYGHGTCGGYAQQFRCVCDDGWFGNCNMTTCPTGTAWFDEAWADGQAHRPAECSNMGTCDRSSGRCACHEGFYGSACQYQECPVNLARANSPADGLPSAKTCSAQGRCLSMRELALESRYNGEPTPYTYGTSFGIAASTSASDSASANAEAADEEQQLLFANASFRSWDADMIHGCACDSTGYQYGPELEAQRLRRHKNSNDNTGGTAGAPWQNGSEFWGFDCSLRRCPFGDDPKVAPTPNSNNNQSYYGGFEVQNVSCLYGNGDGGDTGYEGRSGGSFRLAFRGATTAVLHANATTVADLEAALEALETIGDVSVHGAAVENSVAGGVVHLLDPAERQKAVLCARNGSNATAASVVFLSELGDVPLLRVVDDETLRAAGGTLHVREVTPGVSAFVYCSLFVVVVVVVVVFEKNRQIINGRALFVELATTFRHLLSSMLFRFINNFQIICNQDQEKHRVLRARPLRR